MRKLCLLLILLTLPLAALAAEPEVKLEFCRGEGRTLAWLSFILPREYHAYSHLPGPTGMPTILEFVLEGDGSAPVLYPTGQSERDSFDKNLTVHVYRGETGLLAALPANASGRLFTATLRMLLCSDRHCLPYEKRLTGRVPETLPALASVKWAGQAKLLLAAEDEVPGAVSLEEGSAPPAQNDPEAAEEDMKIPAPEADVNSDAAIQEYNLKPRDAAENSGAYSLGKALLLGLVAGLLLNAMPCVLPVLTLKISGMLLLGKASDKQKLRNFRIHNFCFAAGILTLFTFLAFLLSLADLMWGQLFQSEPLILAMLLIVFVMGLSMLGVFTLPAFDLRIGEDAKNPALKSFFAGLVSTFLATPCSGPLLGGILAWSFTQPLSILVAVFWSVGAGMGMPYIAFGIWPGFAKILPRPGEWMIVVERVLGFLLLATALYLLYVLPAGKRISILALLLIAGFCAWIWGAFCAISAPKLRRWICGSISFLILAGAFYWTLRPEAPAVAWQPFTAATFASELGRKRMLIEFTADWCPNCKFLEASVLTDGNLRSLQKKYNFELIRVDITRSNPAAERLLGQLGSRSIPLTALFPAGQDAHAPVVLRDLYSANELKKALAETFGGRHRVLYGSVDKD